MTYQQTIDYMYAQLPMFSRLGAAAYKKDLHNTIALCNALNNPHEKFKAIHIAGTNGKGSTSHMLAAILQHSGYKTGLYTSPHLKDFRERIKINGQMVSESFVVDFVQKTKVLTAEIMPSFFELTVAMAFEYFAAENVDVAVIETGLGGRLDSTNIITPLVSVITNIGYDHMNILGNTLEQIAFEKAGIIKHGVPVVVGEYLPETKPVFLNKAGIENAPVYFSADAYSVMNVVTKSDLLHCTLRCHHNDSTEVYSLDLTGWYQAKNLCTVLSTLPLLQQAGFVLREIKNALSRVKETTGLHGRWEKIASNPAIILDVAHNEDGIKQLVQQLKNCASQFSQLHIVTGMVKDKEADKILSLLPKAASYYFTQAHIPRALPADELQHKATAHQLKGESYDDVNIALQHAKQRAGLHDLILVCGSVFLVGEVDCK